MHNSRNVSNPGNSPGPAVTSTYTTLFPSDLSLDTSETPKFVNCQFPDNESRLPVCPGTPCSLRSFVPATKHQQTAASASSMPATQLSSFTPSTTAASSMPATQLSSFTPSTTAAAASSAAQYVVEEEMTTVKVPMLRPRPALMKVLHLAGGIGETYTMSEIINHVKDYIRERVLYDEQDPRIVYCGKDLLGAALGVDTFTVHEAINLFRKNCTMEPDSCIRVYRHLVTRPISCQPQATTASGATSYTTAAQPTGTETTTVTPASMSSYHHPAAKQSMPEISRRHTAPHPPVRPASTQRVLNSSQEFSSSLSSTPASSFSSSEPSSSSTSAVIKFQASQSYVTLTQSDLDGKSTRKQMGSADSSSDSGRNSGSWEEHRRPEKSHSRRRRQSTSINVTYDEPDGGTGPWTCQVMMETLPGEMAKPEDDTVMVEFDSDAFSVEYEVDSDTDTEAGEIKPTENSSDESSTSLGAAVLVVCAESDVEYLADYSDSDSDTDAELADADKWECEHCQKKNPPFHRNCGGCWSLRPDWLPSTMKDVQDAACVHQQDTSTQILHSDKSVNVQPQNQQVSKEEIPSSLEQKCDRLDLNNSSAARDAKVCRKRKCSSSLSTSDSQEGKVIERMERMQQAFSGKSGECKTVDKLKSDSLPLGKDEACVVCLTRKKTASIVHGKTGHQSCCYRCATRLKRKRKPCPICRRPIQKVIRNFHV